MKQKQLKFHSLAIEIVTVLLASMVLLPLMNVAGVQPYILPFGVVACYVVLKFIYHLCLFLLTHIITFTSLYHKSRQSDKQIKGDCAFANFSSVNNSNDILMKRIVLFHYEYQHEQQQYLQQQERMADEKLHSVLQYTRNTFKRLDFDEEEIFQICECVRYFVTNRQVLTTASIRIKRHATVTQISIKNFAWNIAFQYGISRDITAQFVMQTFYEWFANSTIDTIRKNLRTTTGHHKIEINENII